MNHAGKDTLTPQEKRARLEALLRQKVESAEEAFPLSHGQQALWFLYRSAPQSAAYNTAFVARVTSPLNCSIAQQAFHALSERHPLLRVTFSIQNAEPVQRAQSRQHVFFERIDASVWSDDELQRQVSESYKRPFNLEQCQNEGKAGLEVMEQHLAASKWLAAGKPTIADIACYPYVMLAPMGEISLEPYPNVREWLARVETLPGWVALDA